MDEVNPMTRWIALLALLAIAGTARSDAPNFLVIVTDDQRPDTIHALGNPHIRTPVLDRLVREGTSFTRAFCANPHCVPSRAEILSGCSGFRNGVWKSGLRFSPGLVFWGDALQAAGYHTVYAGKWMNDGTPHTRGYRECVGWYGGGGAGGRPMSYPEDHKGAPVTGYRGWHFKTDTGEAILEQGIGLGPRTSAQIVDAVLARIQRGFQQPFFLHLNFTAPHDPLHIPPGMKERYAQLAKALPVPANFLPEHPFDHGHLGGRDEELLPWPRTRDAIRRELAAYYVVIEDLDAQLGRLIVRLEADGLLDRTVVIFTSDHGLALGSHGLMGKQNMYDHTLRVPLLFRGPGIPANVRRGALCYLRDLYPTTCDLAGAAIPGAVQGKSLVPALREAQAVIHERVYGHFDEVQRMVQGERYKLTWYPKTGRRQLFDLQADPGELRDLVAHPEMKTRVAGMMRALESWLAGQGVK